MLLTCGHEGCPSTELETDGLCPVHADPRRVTPADLMPGYGWKRMRPSIAMGLVTRIEPTTPAPVALVDVVRSGRAACGPDTAHLFEATRDGETSRERQVRQWEAARLCAVCPVRLMCESMLDELADTVPEFRGGHGVWAGHTIVLARESGRYVEPVADPHRHECVACRRDLPLEAFPPSVQNGTSYDYRCRECWAADGRERAARPGTKATRARQARERRAAETPEQREHRLGIQRASRQRAKDRREAERAARTGERVA